MTALFAHKGLLLAAAQFKAKLCNSQHLTLEDGVSPTLAVHLKLRRGSRKWGLYKKLD